MNHAFSWVSRIGIVLVLLAMSVQLRSQTVYLPTNHEVYEYLKRLEAKQFFSAYRDAAQPISRRMIAEHLLEASRQRDRMTTLEQESMDFFLGEFAEELEAVDTSGSTYEGRWRLYSTKTIDGMLHTGLSLQVDYSKYNSSAVTHEAHGFNLYGSLFHDFGFYFNFVDNSERGSAANGLKRNSPDPGVIPSVDRPGHLEYDMTTVQLSYRWRRIDFSIENFENKWSLGRRGSLMFSRKAPPAPQIKVRFPITDWMDFIVVHAELKSDVIDSARSYATSAGSMKLFRPVDRMKYLSAHMFELTPVRGVDISLGESIVYSDRNPQLMYLLPLMFYKSGEHYNEDTDNSQMFANLDLNLIHGVNLYASAFIDEFSFGRALSGDRARNQYGITSGVETFDVGMNGIECLLEYTYINPWVYSHKYQATRFTNNSYDMGHWIGQNADDLFLQVTYRPARNWKIGLTGELYRKGDTTDIKWQYDDKKVFPLLFGRRHEERSIGMFGTFQPFRDLFIDWRLRAVKVDDDQNPSQSHSYSPEFRFGLTYGIW